MNILVTGGEGFVGKTVVGLLRTEGHNVISIDSSSEDKSMKVDVTNRNQVKTAFTIFKPEAVIHLASLAGATGKGGGAESIKFPHEYFHVNLNGVLNIYETCRELEINKVLCMSSFSPYGIARCPIDEETTFSPNNPYGSSKACVEEIAKCYAINYGIKTLILRPPLICGEKQKEMNALREFVYSAILNKPITIFGEGKHVREFIHPQDIARAYSAGLNYLERMEKPYDIIILGNKPISMNKLASTVIRYVGKGVIEIKPVTNSVFDQFTDHSKAKRVLGWTPKISTNEIVQRVIEDIKSSV